MSADNQQERREKESSLVKLLTGAFVPLTGIGIGLGLILTAAQSNNNYLLAGGAVVFAGSVLYKMYLNDREGYSL